MHVQKRLCVDALRVKHSTHNVYNVRKTIKDIPKLPPFLEAALAVPCHYCILTVAMDWVPRIAGPVRLLRLRLIISSDSLLESFVMGMEKVLLVSPGANVSVPEVIV